MSQREETCLHKCRRSSCFDSEIFVLKDKWLFANWFWRNFKSESEAQVCTETHLLHRNYTHDKVPTVMGAPLRPCAHRELSLWKLQPNKRVFNREGQKHGDMSDYKPREGITQSCSVRKNKQFSLFGTMWQVWHSLLLYIHITHG